MLLCKIDHIDKTFSNKILFQHVTFEIRQHDHIGIVGENGCGKTTLLNILTNKIMPDEGKVTWYATYQYFQQFDEQLYDDISGGEALRNRLQETIQSNAFVYLLDEPISNLDNAGIQKVSYFLHHCDTYVIVSHDPQLLSECTKIIEISHHQVQIYEGNYEAYQIQKEKQNKKIQEEYNTYIQQKQQIEHMIDDKRKKMAKVSKKPKHMSHSEFKMRGYVALRTSFQGKEKKAAKQIKALQKRIKHMEVKNKPHEKKTVQFDLSNIQQLPSNIVVSAHDFSFAYDQKIIFQHASFTLYNRRCTCILGENGSGKTTLMNNIASMNEQFWYGGHPVFAKLDQDFRNLDKQRTLWENAKMDCVQSDQVLRRICDQLLFDTYDLKKQVSLLSGGEKIRLSIIKLLVSNANVLLLDEPTNYMDSDSVDAFIHVVKEYPGCMLIITHDERVLRKLAEELWILKNKLIFMFQGNYEEYLIDQKNKKKEEKIEKSILEMRLSHASAKHYQTRDDQEKERLEKEMETIIQQLKHRNM